MNRYRYVALRVLLAITLPIWFTALFLWRVTGECMTEVFGISEDDVNE